MKRLFGMASVILYWLVISVAIVIIIAFVAGIIVAGLKQETKVSFSQEAVREVKIYSNPSVRSDPYKEKGERYDSNLICIFKNAESGSWVGMSVKKVYISDIETENGKYIGINVNDLSDEVIKIFFNKKVKKDPDGIVWINQEYISYK